MRISNFFAVALLAMVSLFVACGNDGDAARDAATENAGGSAVTPNVAPNNTAAPTPPPATTPEPPQNAAGVWHYTCPNGCEGGAGSAVACAKCGTTLAHNTAYHDTPSTPSTLPNGNANLTPVPSPNAAPPAPKPAEPAQNAAGIWHYICPSGCAGGAGSAVACSKCGTTLAHNTAYHQ